MKIDRPSTLQPADAVLTESQIDWCADSASYRTALGTMCEGDSAAIMASLPSGMVNLVFTSPPYALHFKKEYGNADKDAYVGWFKPFAEQIHRVLADDGSFVLNIGGSYNAGSPTRSLYHFRLLLMLCDELGSTRNFTQAFRNAELDMHFSLAQDMTPLEYVLEILHREGSQGVVGRAMQAAI